METASNHRVSPECIRSRNCVSMTSHHRYYYPSKEAEFLKIHADPPIHGFTHALYFVHPLLQVQQSVASMCIKEVVQSTGHPTLFYVCSSALVHYERFVLKKGNSSAALFVCTTYSSSMGEGKERRHPKQYSRALNRNRNQYRSYAIAGDYRDFV